MRLLLILLVSLSLVGCATTASKQKRVQGQVYKYGENFSAANANVTLAMAYLKKGELQNAKEKLLLAKKQAPRDPATWYAMGFYQETVGDMKLAKESYQKSVKLAPKNGDVQNNYGTFLCRQGHYRESIKHFMLAIKDENYLDTAGAYENAGLCAMKIPDKKLAENYFKRAIDHDPVISKSLYEMAELKFEAGDYTESKQLLDRYNFFSKPQPESLWLGVRLGWKLGDESWAEKQAKELVEKFPKSSQALKLDVFSRDEAMKVA